MSGPTIEGALKVSAILLVALVAGIPLKGRSAALRHWVLAVAIACAWATPPLSGVLPSWLSAAVWHSNTAASNARDASVAKDGALPRIASMDGAAVQTAVSTARATRPSRANLRATDIAWGVWLLGSVVSVLTLLVGLARLWWLASRARIIDSGPWCELGEEVRRTYGLLSPIRLFQSDHPSLLVTWGSRRPKILLPATASGWSRDRIQIVLAHELAHIARGDWAVQLAAEGLRAVYWFDPLAWFTCRRLRVESERACDDAVLARGIDGPEYATHLLALARTLHAGRQPWLPAPAMARPSSLEGRIRAMLNPTLNRRPISWPARSATMAALLALTVAVAGLRAQAFYSLSGTVLDPTNSVLPDTRLVLTNATSRAKYEVRSDAAGRFEFVGLPPATYGLEASLPGFAVLTEKVEIAGHTERDLRLRVGSLEETITVTDRSVAAVQPDPSAAQARENARRRFSEFLERERARCAAGGTSAPIGVRVGGNILQPSKLLDKRPVYPEHLEAARVGGTVTMDVVIGTDGFVRDIRNLKGPDPALEASAADAVRQWQFSTTLLNCEPIEVEMHVTTNFRLQP